MYINEFKNKIVFQLPSLKRLHVFVEMWMVLNLFTVSNCRVLFYRTISVLTCMLIKSCHCVARGSTCWRGSATNE